LEAFLQEIRANALEVVLEHILQLEALLGSQVLGVLQEAIFDMLQHIFVALTAQAPDLRSPNFIERFVQCGHNVVAVQDVEGVWQLLLDNLEVRLPHVRANKLHGSTPLFALLTKKAHQGFDGSVSRDIQQTPDASVKLVNQGEVLLSLPEVDFVYSYRGNARHIPVL